MPIKCLSVQILAIEEDQGGHWDLASVTERFPIGTDSLTVSL